MGNRLIDDDDLLLAVAGELNGCRFGDLANLRGRVASQSGKSAHEKSVQEVKRLLKKLSKDGFIKVEASQAGQEGQLIELTLWGLLRVLDSVFMEKLTDYALKEKLDKIVSNQGKKLLPFMFSPYFANKEIALKAIRRFLNFNTGQYQRPKQELIDKLANFGFKKMSSEEMDKMMLESFADFFFLISPENLAKPKEEMSLWDLALAKDEDTKRYAVERICRYRDRYSPKVEKANQRIGFFEDCKPGKSNSLAVAFVRK
ncbi:MAG: hypothetical protein ACLQO7_01360 [Candidatus Bathyarchaeia archaeon]